MPLFDRCTIVICKVISVFIRLLGIGAGSTWPGEIALRLSPDILRRLSLKHGNIVLVAGTNGKTTTVKMIETILSSAGKRVRRNAAGANLDNGLVSTLIDDATIFDGFQSDIILFEVDEATFSNIAYSVSPKVVVLLNLFRDQLDRYGEVDTIAEKWKTTLLNLNPKTTELIIANGDDPQLVYISDCWNGKISFFGLDDPALFLPVMQHATDSIYCPRCGNRLTFGGVYFSHLGKWACGRCGLTHPKLAITSKDISSPVEGVYNIYNTLAATLVAEHFHISVDESKNALVIFEPAFGRMERIRKDDKDVTILLSKNPTGFNESLRTVLVSIDKGPLLLVLNDRIPDGTDVSWIWDVDFETLSDYQHPMKERDKHMIVISGDRAYDMAIRLKYAGIKESNVRVLPIPVDAINEALIATKQDERLWILPTYSAMLEVREIFTGKKIL